jgi:purine nucleoside permease
MGARHWPPVALLIGVVPFLDHLGTSSAAAAPDVIAPKVLTVTMFQTGDPLAGGSGEASVWVEKDTLNQVVPIPGSYSPLYCDASFDHCLVITGVMAANAAATLMAVGLSERLDLSRSYLMVASSPSSTPARCRPTGSTRRPLSAARSNGARMAFAPVPKSSRWTRR